MTKPPEKLWEVRQWIEKAEHDLKNASHTLTLSDSECPFDTACFHAQQCAEKYLKGLLVFLKIKFPRVHDLRLLLQLSMQKVPLKLEVSEVVGLNRYTIEGRYPGEWEPIGRSESEQAVAVARKVRRAVRKYLPAQAVSWK